MRKLLIIVFVCFYSLCFGQIKSGHITYKIDFSTEDNQLKSTLGFLEGSKMDVFFKDQYTRSEMKMGGMITISTFTDTIGDVVIILMDGINGKSAIKTPISEMETVTDTSISTPIYEDEFKDILGFSCQKVIVENAFGEVSNYWISNEINAVRIGQNYLSEEVKGFPLEFELYNKGLKMHLTAINFSDNLDEYNLEELFNSYIPDGYNILSKEELFQSGF